MGSACFLFVPTPCESRCKRFISLSNTLFKSSHSEKRTVNLLVSRTVFPRVNRLFNLQQQNTRHKDLVTKRDSNLLMIIRHKHSRNRSLDLVKDHSCAPWSIIGRHRVLSSLAAVSGRKEPNRDPTELSKKKALLPAVARSLVLAVEEWGSVVRMPRCRYLYETG